METLEQIKARVEAALPQTRLQLLVNETVTAQNSLLVDSASAAEVFRFLRDDSQLRLDYLSNLTGVDWPEVMTKEKVKVKRVVDGVEQEIEETVEKKKGGYLEVVYHLYSMSLKHGPLILRQRTENRADKTNIVSITSIYRAAEFQEREVFDLYGVVFDGHPDLRRILMWEGFTDFPMRKDYQEPDDYEWEPTPHDEVLEKTKQHYPAVHGTPA